MKNAPSEQHSPHLIQLVYRQHDAKKGQNTPFVWLVCFTHQNGVFSVLLHDSQKRKKNCGKSNMKVSAIKAKSEVF